MVNFKSKVFQKCLISFGSIYFGLFILFFVFLAESSPQKISHPDPFAVPVLETFARGSYFCIIVGIFLLLDIKDGLSKHFLRSENQLDFDRFKQDQSYSLKVGSYFIQQHNQEIFIHTSVKKILVYTLVSGFIFAFLIYIALPFTQLFLANLNLHSSLYQNSNFEGYALLDFCMLCLIFLFGMFFFVGIFVQFRKNLIIINPVSHLIIYHRFFIKPLRIVWGGIQELTFPLDNILSLQTDWELFNETNFDLNDFRRYNTFKLQFLTISTANWNGDSKLFKLFSPRNAKDRVKFISDKDIDALSEIKTFFIDYAKHNYNL